MITYDTLITDAREFSLVKDILTYAINDFNEPSCAHLEHPSLATRTGSWTASPSGQTYAEYLTAHTTDATSADTSVTFEPDIKHSGNYTVSLYTPGCEQDGTCSSRGIVNVTGTFATGTRSSAAVQTLIYQTNNFEKYDVIYSGYVDASSSTFRPSVKLAPLPNQGNNLTVVASYIRLEQISSSGGLNGLYEYDPVSTNTTSRPSLSVVDQAGTQLDAGASIQTIVELGDVTFVGGNFTSRGLKNIMFFSDQNATALSQGGLNGQVDSMLTHGDLLYVGGSFTGTVEGGNSRLPLQNVAAYSLTSQTWSPLGGGVNGRVTSVLNFPLNVSSEINETTIAVSGDFDRLLAFDKNPPVAVSGIAIWVPSKQNWLQNLNISQTAFTGQLSAATSANGTVLLAGSLDSDGLAVSDAVLLGHPSGQDLESFSLNMNSSRSRNSAIFAGTFDTSSNRNLTILGGHFSAVDSNMAPVENLLILNGADGTVTGLNTAVDSNSTFLSVAVSGNTLYAGGNVTGAVGKSSLNGYVVYDLASGTVPSSQPPPLTGSDVSVTAIAPRAGSSEIYFAGNFDAAGSLPCPSVCFWDTSQGQWNRPGVSLSGTVMALTWASSQMLIAVGNLTVSNNQTAIATYNTKSQAWNSFPGASLSAIPGTVTAFSPASEDVSKFWLAGQSANGSAFMISYDGSSFQSVGSGLFGDGTRILGLELFSVSQEHGQSPFLSPNQVLLVTGQLVIPNFGNASAAFYNGSHVSPFLLSTTSDGQPGVISQVFSEKQNPFNTRRKFISSPLGRAIHALGLVWVFLI